LKQHYGNKLSGAVITAEEVSNTILVSASPESFNEIAKLIKAIDDIRPRPSPGPGSGSRVSSPAGGTNMGTTGTGATTTAAGHEAQGLGTRGRGTGGGAGKAPDSTSSSTGTSINGTTSSSSSTSSGPTSLSVLKLKHSKADGITTVLKKVFPSVEITPDPQSNQLIIRATFEETMEVNKLLKELDVAGSNGVPYP
jgi:type II secretory pathway component GspD/PulD (secretin)